MRAIAVVLLASLVSAGSALADPPTVPAAKPAAKPAAPAPAQKGRKVDKARPAGKAAPAAPARFGLGGMAAAAGAAAVSDPEKRERAKGDARRLDLTPQRQLQGPAGDRRGTERSNSVGLGDDGDWKVQAVQVGAITAAFAALWAVCGGGNCMLPDFLGSSREQGPSPDLQIREEPQLRDAH